MIEEKKCNVTGPHPSCDSHNLTLMDQLWTMLDQVFTLWQKENITYRMSQKYMSLQWLYITN